MYKPTMNLRIVEWCIDIRPGKIEEVLEQMWVHEDTGLVEWRELETVTAKEAGYLDDSSHSEKLKSGASP